ncbi:unnamed protein product, partial [marine sediment metagenome]
LSLLLEARSFNGGLKEVKSFALNISRVLKEGKDIITK